MRDRPAIRRRSGLALWALLAVTVACARVRPLDGGPPDVTPPSIVRVQPTDSTTNLSRLPRFEIEWSEELATNTALGGVRIDPPVRLDVRMDGRKMTVTVAESLPPDTTVVVRLLRSIRDRGGRDNPLQAETPFIYSTGPRIVGGSVLGKVVVKGRPEEKAVVRWEPVPADTGLAGRRRRGPSTGVDPEGLFHLAGVPPERRFVLRAFVDSDGDRTPDEEELAAVFPETLALAPGGVRRGIDWNLIDPNDPGTISGVAANQSGVRGAIAIAVRRIQPAAGAAPDSALPESLMIRADTLRPRPLAVPPRDSIPWAKGYLELEPGGYVRRLWTVVYASPRGDYSVRVAPGTHALLAFVDARRDSVPGLAVGQDSTALFWEPLVVGAPVFVGPAEKVRARTLTIRGP